MNINKNLIILVKIFIKIQMSFYIIFHLSEGYTEEWSGVFVKIDIYCGT